MGQPQPAEVGSPGSQAYLPRALEARFDLEAASHGQVAPVAPAASGLEPDMPLHGSMACQPQQAGADPSVQQSVPAADLLRAQPIDDATQLFLALKRGPAEGSDLESKLAGHPEGACCVCGLWFCQHVCHRPHPYGLYGRAYSIAFH